MVKCWCLWSLEYDFGKLTASGMCIRIELGKSGLGVVFLLFSIFRSSETIDLGKAKSKVERKKNRYLAFVRHLTGSDIKESHLLSCVLLSFPFCNTCSSM